VRIVDTIGLLGSGFGLIEAADVLLGLMIVGTNARIGDWTCSGHKVFAALICLGMGSAEGVRPNARIGVRTCPDHQALRR
jgi:hypothetical protein